ncbi:MAG: hypothetical protein C4519_16220 [Desulfobacteraceae bacterium]|nr:MAG: hypothetical protein C4519_16220 [Desulfobacteraceae bacterium]
MAFADSQPGIAAHAPVRPADRSFSSFSDSLDFQRAGIPAGELSPPFGAGVETRTGGTYNQGSHRKRRPGAMSAAVVFN